MKTVIIGGVAAGTKTAAKLKRENPAAEVVIYTKSQDISYAGCGLPYYIGGSIASREELIVNTPAKYTGLTGVPVHTGFEAVSVDPEAKTVSFANGETVGYDNLVIATGAEPVVPPVEGVTLPGVFKVRTPEDAITARQYIEENSVKKAVVVGGGFIGLEVAENLMEKGIAVTVLDMAPQLMPGVFDSEMADYIRRQLQSKGMRVMTGTALQGIQGGEKVTGVATAAGNLPADIVFLAVGIRPATKFLQGSGLQMERGCILVNEYLETNLPHIYAVGDCAMVRNRVTGKPMWSAMGSTANIAGRALALGLGGEKAAYPGALGTAVVKLAADLNAAKTGLTEKAAAEAGYPVITATCAIDDKAHYYPGSSSFIIKMIADKETHKLLGLQVAGPGEVDKMADIAVVGISAGLKAEDFTMMDFAYAPPFSTAIHPFATACGVLCNKLSGRLESFTPAEYMAGAAKGYRIVDLLPAPTLTGFDWLDMTRPETAEGKFKKDEKLLLVCSRGKRAYLTQNKLRALGYTNTRVLEGGATVNVIKRALPSGGKLPAAEVKRLKGLGCLQDKRYDDVFNVRIITRNGKLTAEEGRIITEAAEKFGSGAFTMTTPPDDRDPGRPLRKRRAADCLLKRAWPRNRRHRFAGPPGRLLQGHDLPVRPDRYL